MENYICINGKRAELTEEQIKQLGIELPKVNPFAKLTNDELYYFITNHGTIDDSDDLDYPIDKLRYNVANYCTDKSIMERRALHEILNRLLWRYSMEHKANEFKYSNTGRKIRYSIGYWESDDTWRSDGPGFHVTTYARGYELCPYFESEEIALNAIKEIVEPFMAEHPEFKW